MQVESDLLAAVRTDLVRLLAAWRELLFPSDADRHPVHARWSHESTAERLAFWAWSGLGALLIVVAYPFVAAGLWTRFVVRRIGQVAAALGLVAVVATVAVVWSLLTALAWNQLPTAGFRAVLVASVVATASTAAAWGATRLGGRLTTVGLAFPLAVSALFLPPVTAALASPTLGEIVLPRSTSLAVWLLDNVLVVADLNSLLRREFDLSGLGFVAMWFGLSLPIGWGLGLLVAVANRLRPRGERHTGGREPTQYRG